MSGLQQRIDALVARALTEEPTEEARTSAWIAIRMMKQHGGAIRLPGAPAASADFFDTILERMRREADEREVIVARRKAEREAERRKKAERTSAPSSVHVDNARWGMGEMPWDRPSQPSPSQPPPYADDVDFEARERIRGAGRGGFSKPDASGRIAVRCLTPGVTCWWCRRLIRIGEEYGFHPLKGPLCGDCCAKGQ
jgi:hypothetical protein